MSMHYEWDTAETCGIGVVTPNELSSDEGHGLALVLGGSGGGALVIEGDKEQLIAFAKQILIQVEAIEWEEMDYFIELGIRNNEQGYVDSIKLIRNVLKDIVPEQDEALDRALDMDLGQIIDSGYDLDTMTDILTEWEERAEEVDMHAYADGEAGVYRVTNVPPHE